jgi:hypothetical protein
MLFGDEIDVSQTPRVLLSTSSAECSTQCVPVVAPNLAASTRPDVWSGVLFPAIVSGNRVVSEPRAWDILPDGRLIGITSATDPAARSSSSEIHVVLNWFEELKALVPSIR